MARALASKSEWARGVVAGHWIPLKNPCPSDPTLRAGGCHFRGRFVFFFHTLHAGRLGDGLTRWTDSTFLSAEDHWISSPASRPMAAANGNGIKT
jgi:hypothetical protein